MKKTKSFKEEFNTDGEKVDLSIRITKEQKEWLRKFKYENNLSYSQTIRFLLISAMRGEVDWIDKDGNLVDFED